MITFNFEGHGNYSNSFNWDNGLNTQLQSRVNFKKARKEEERLAQTFPMCNQRVLPKTPEKGVYASFVYEHGGTRSIYGYVIAENSAEAKQLLEDYENSFQIIEHDIISVADEAMEYN